MCKPANNAIALIALTIYTGCFLSAGVGSIRLIRDIGETVNHPIYFGQFQLVEDQLFLISRESYYSMDLTDRGISQIGLEIASSYGNNAFPELYPQQDGLVYFLEYSSTTGYEWWQTDGTPGGTYALPELGVGLDGWISRDKIRNTSDSLEYYGKQGELYGWWRLDSGNHSLILSESDFGASGHIKDCIPVKDGSFFVFETAESTSPVYFLPDSGAPPELLDPGDKIKRFTTWNNRLIARQTQMGIDIFEVIDSSTGNTTEIYRWESSVGRPDVNDSLAVEDPDLFFCGGRNLWIARGADPVLRILSYGWPNSKYRFDTIHPLFFKDGHVYVIVYGEDPTSLWKVAVDSGTRELVATLTVGNLVSGEPYGDVVAHDEKWYFYVGEDDNLYGGSNTRQHLWESDGTPGGTRKLDVSNSPYQGILPYQNQLIVPYSSLNGTIFRFLDLDTLSKEDWFIPTPESSNLDGVDTVMGTYDNYLLFTSRPGGEGVLELWTSDGSTMGTFPFQPKVNYPRNLYSTDHGAFVYSDENKYWGLPGNRQLWQLDPATGLSQEIALDFLSDESVTVLGIEALGDGLYFEILTGSEISLLKYSVPSGSLSQISLPDNQSAGISTIGDHLLIGSGQSDTLYALDPSSNTWQAILEDVDFLYSSPYGAFVSATSYEHRLVSLNGGGLAITDGTTDGSNVLCNALPDGMEMTTSFALSESVAYVLLVNPSSSVGPSLYAIPLSGGDPVQLMQLSPDAYMPSFNGLAVVGNDCYFRADDGSTGFEPWITDGTPEGTHLIKDIIPGEGDSFYKTHTMTDSLDPPFVFTVYQGKVYFNAFTSAPGKPIMKFWVTDGTESGTYPVTYGESIAPLDQVHLTYVFGDILVAENRSSGIWTIHDETVHFNPSKGHYPSGMFGERFEPRVFDGGDLLYVQGESDAYGSELFAIDLDSTRGFFSNAVRASDGWSWHEVYGWIYGVNYPWIWLQGASTWLYCMGDGLPGASFYQGEQGWLYSPEEVYPWVYRSAYDDWVELD